MIHQIPMMILQRLGKLLSHLSTACSVFVLSICKCSWVNFQKAADGEDCNGMEPCC